MVGVLAHVSKLILTAMLGFPALNMSLVIEQAHLSIGQDGSLDFYKIDPAHVIYEEPLSTFVCTNRCDRGWLCCIAQKSQNETTIIVVFDQHMM